MPLGHPQLLGGVEWLVASSRPDRGVELSAGPPDSTALDTTAWLTPDQAELLALCLLAAARQVRAEQGRLAEDAQWRELARREAGA